MSGQINGLDLNARSKMPGFVDCTALHFAVRANDYDLLKQLLDYPGLPAIQQGLKDKQGKNAIDLAYELGYQTMIVLL